MSYRSLAKILAITGSVCLRRNIKIELSWSSNAGGSRLIKTSESVRTLKSFYCLYTQFVVKPLLNIRNEKNPITKHEGNRANIAYNKFHHLTRISVYLMGPECEAITTPKDFAIFVVQNLFCCVKSGFCSWLVLKSSLLPAS